MAGTETALGGSCLPDLHSAFRIPHSALAMSIYRKVGIASLIMMASVFLSRVIGLFREMVIAWAAGAGAHVDAYQVAFILPEILNHAVASGFLSVTFIPIFSGYLARNEEEKGWRAFNVILTVFGVFLILLIALGEAFTPLLIRLAAPGLRDPAIQAEAVRMTRIILPAQLFFFCGGLFMAVQFARERFAIPALTPLIYNVGIILGGLLLGRRMGMEGFAWGVLGGAFAGGFALQWWGAKRSGMRFSPVFDVRDPELRRYLRLTLPLMIGLTMTFSTEIFFKFFGSYLPRGGIAALNYAFRVTLMLVGLFGQAVGMASFPFLARLAAENRIGEMNELLDRTLRYLLLVIPLSVLVMVLRHEVVFILFQRGRFDAAATEMTARSLLFLLAGAFAFAAQTVVVRGYYARMDTLLPSVFGTIGVLLSIPFYLLGMHYLGITGIAIAVSLSAVFQVVLLYGMWNRREKRQGASEVYASFVKISGLSAVVGLVLEWLRREALHGFDTATVTGCIWVSAVVAFAFSVMVISAGRMLRIGEISEGVDRLLRKIRVSMKDEG